MNIPSDPFMLLSYINTKLRDFYPTLDELCKSLDIDRRSLESRLATIGYIYDPGVNKFC